MEKNWFGMNLFTKVHMTGTSALDITVARTPQIPVPLQAILQEHCNHNVVNIVFWLASVMIVSNKPTKLLAYGLQNANCNWF